MNIHKNIIVLCVALWVYDSSRNLSNTSCTQHLVMSGGRQVKMLLSYLIFNILSMGIK